MILTPDEAKQGFCKIVQPTMRPMSRPIETPCLAEKCMTYWRWFDEGHQKGYCALAGKPEF